MGDRAHYKAKCSELEEIVQLSLQAFSLIPTGQIRKGYQWLPSDDCLRLIERAKNSAMEYSQAHWENGK